MSTSQLFLTLFYLLTNISNFSIAIDGIYAVPEVGSRYRLRWQDSENLRLSRFIPNLRTVLVIHGFASDGGQEMNLTVGFIRAGYPANYMFLLWSASAGSPEGSPSVDHSLELTPAGFLAFPGLYLATVEKIPNIAQRAATYLAWLHEIRYIQGKDITLIGHSLGSHVAGSIGLIYNILTGDKIGRIVGLDPAGPLFTFPPTKNRPLQGSDANMVQLYHTNAGFLGAKPGTIQGAHLEIVVNGGTFQPGCKGLSVSVQTNINALLCDHLYSEYMFTDSVYHPRNQIPWKACKCPYPDKGFGPLSECMIECRESISGFEEPPQGAHGRYYVRYSREYGILPGLNYIKESKDGDHQIVGNINYTSPGSYYRNLFGY